IEKACELNDYKRNVYLCERICGICNFIHAMAYSESIEKITGVEVPERAKYLRTIWSELGRLQSHLLWMGLFADALGFESLFMHVWKYRELVLELHERTAGHRIHLSTCAIGGVNRDLDENVISQYRATLSILKVKLDELAPVFYKDRGIIERTVGKGILPKGKATLLGAVGPTIRGSGISQDMRKLGYEAYGLLDFKPIVHEGEDSFSRMQVRIEEVYQSIELINRALNQMPAGPIVEKNTRFPNGSVATRVEQPRGEVFYFIEGNGTNRLSRCRIRTPTMANIPSLLTLFVGHEVADIPVILMSVDPCVACTERVERC
ncbi:MAG: nickel-dependent hydrogenase large subunit, partial [Candidatus Methanomethylicus sp.]|nr:nickel-dependent hydrogenase large subunit [Candidatus Methanomethylicus sp.]